jgi:hypothetical protein
VRYVSGGVPAGPTIDEFKHLEIVGKPPVSQQLDVASDLLNGVFVVLREIARNADQPRRRPLNVVRRLVPKAPLYEDLKLRLVIH